MKTDVGRKATKYLIVVPRDKIDGVEGMLGSDWWAVFPSMLPYTPGKFGTIVVMRNAGADRAYLNRLRKRYLKPGGKVTWL